MYELKISYFFNGKTTPHFHRLMDGLTKLKVNYKIREVKIHCPPGQLVRFKLFKITRKRMRLPKVSR
jgi:hypothetical protein